MSAASLTGHGPGLLGGLLATIWDIPRRGMPTHYPPGSAGKIAVLAARVARGEPMFHADDPREQTEPAALGDEELSDRSKHRDLPGGITIRRWLNGTYCYRVRPYVPGRGCVQVGYYRSLSEARRALRRFRDELDEAA